MLPNIDEFENEMGGDFTRWIHACILISDWWDFSQVFWDMQKKPFHSDRENILKNDTGWLILDHQ